MAALSFMVPARPVQYCMLTVAHGMGPLGINEAIVSSRASGMTTATWTQGERERERERERKRERER